MERDDYTRVIAIIFMGIGFIAAIIGAKYSEALFNIAIGWEAASFLIVVLMQKSLYNSIREKAEFRKLKRNTRLATETQKAMDGVDWKDKYEKLVELHFSAPEEEEEE